MRIVAIDPGPERSALVVCEVPQSTERLPEIAYAVMLPNNQMRLWLGARTFRCALIEKISPYGQPIGWETIDTIMWAGRFLEVAGVTNVTLMPRTDVKLALCGTTRRITDAAIRGEIIHRYGGKDVAVGKQKTPGPLYALKADLWQAFALVMAWRELQATGK